MGIRNGFRWRDKPPLGTLLDGSRPLSSDLRAFWAANEGTGDRLADLSGNGNHATLFGASAWTAGSDGPGLVFTSTSQYGSVPDSASLKPTTAITVWAAVPTVTATTSGYLISKTVGNWNYYLRLNQPNQSIDGLISTAGGLIGLSIGGQGGFLAPYLGKPLQVAITYDDSSACLYVNGVLAQSKPASGALSLTNDSLGIGARGGDGNNAESAAITAGGIWGRALSAGEIAALNADPYAMFAAPSVRRFVAGVGSGGVTPGTLALAAAAQSAIASLGIQNTPPSSTATIGASSQSASTSLGVQNTPPASTTTITAASQTASVSLGMMNTPPASTVTVAAQSPVATASLGLIGVAPSASVVTLSAQAQAALAVLGLTNTPPPATLTLTAQTGDAATSLGLTNTPPASTLVVSAVAGDASASLGLTALVGIGLTVSAQSGSAQASLGLTNVPPASTVTVSASAESSTASLAATVANPVTLALAAVSGRATASLAASVSGIATPTTLTLTAEAQAAVSHLFVRMVDPATLPSDRLAYAAIRDLLAATNEFDAVLVGRQAETTPIPAKWATYAVLTPTGNPQLRSDGSPSMLASVASYRLLIVARAASVRDDEQAYQRADRLKGLILGTLLDPANRSYGGFCVPWLSTLCPTGDPVKIEDEWRVELRGTFTYLVNTLTGYSQSTVRL